MQLTTGRHPRRYCPVLLPAACETPHYTVQLGDVQVIGQRLTRADGSCVCCLLPAAPANEAVAASSSPALVEMLNVQLTDHGNGQLAVAYDGEPFTVYHYAGAGNRPFCYPVLGPGGVKVTRGYPMIPDVPGESDDHPHQRSLWTAFGEVNGHDDWAEGPTMARIVHNGFSVVESGPVFGRFVEQLDWVTADGVKLMSEEREVIFYNTPAEHRLLDWRVSLHAAYGPVRLGDTKEGGILSVRVNCEMEGRRTGVITNGWGGVGEAECWGKPAPWCDYSGLVEGTRVGIALFDGRENPGFPTNWHVRDYGLMTANIFAQQAFHNENPLYRGDRVIQAGASLRFDYRVFIHAGDAAQAEVGARYLDYAYPPTAE